MKKVQVKNLPFGEKPAERILRDGLESLSNVELLSLILWKGKGKFDVIETSKNLLKEYNGSIKKLLSADINELMKKGLGLSQASRVKAVFELHKRLLEENDKLGAKISSIESVLKIVQSLKYYERETLVVLYLDPEGRLIEKEIVSIGDDESSIFDIKGILKKCLLIGSKNIILVHNHPNGKPEPSKDDILSTKRLVEAGKLLGINVLDHIILAGDEYFSFKEFDKL